MFDLRQNNFVLNANDTYKVDVSPSAPQYFWHHPEQASLLTVKSLDNLCMTLSVQNGSCPVYDTDTNVDFDGIYQVRYFD